MDPTPFDLLQWRVPGPVKEMGWLSRRRFVAGDYSFAKEAQLFVPGEALATSINAALAVGEPLLITGEPGTGKTQTAYYLAWKLGLGEVEHFQVKSDSTARDLLYDFDSVKYFHDAQRGKAEAGTGWESMKGKSAYVERRALWKAIQRSETTRLPAVMLIDEIDKAPRDFPNDLLHELDKMEFTVLETGEKVAAPRALRPIVVITSNSERRLPEPFLRRCVYHHIEFREALVEAAVDARRKQFAPLSDGFIELARSRFLELRNRELRKRPATAEFLVWLRVLAAEAETTPEELLRRLNVAKDRPGQLPHLGVLLKDRQDLAELGE